MSANVRTNMGIIIGRKSIPSNDCALRTLSAKTAREIARAKVETTVTKMIMPISARFCHHIFSEDRHRSCCRLDESCYYSEASGFPCSVRSNEAKNLSFLNLERDSVESFYATIYLL